MKKLFVLLLFAGVSLASLAQNKITQVRDLSGFSFITLQMAATVYVTQENKYSVQVSAKQETLEYITTEVENNTLYISLEGKENWKDIGDVIITVSLPKPNGLHLACSGTMTAQNNFVTDYLSLEVHGSGEIVMKDFKAEKAEVTVAGSGGIKHGNGLAEGIVEEVHGSGAIVGQSLMCSLLSLTLAGSGGLDLSEITCDKLMATLVGSGNIKIEKGVASNVLLESSGSGEIIAGNMVGKQVSAKVTGSGSISVSVLETLDATVAGSGEVVYKGNPANLSKNVNGAGGVRQM